MQRLSDAQAAITKAYGKNSGGKGYKFPEFDRLPSGIFNLDLALAGGIPMGAVTILYGNESSGKTSLALRLAHQYQQRHGKKQKVAWIDVENSWDKPWVSKHGVKTEDVYLYKPTTAEEAADIAGEIAMSEDAGLVIVDSIAALASIDQLEKSAEQTVVAGAVRPTVNLMRKLGAGITEHAKAGQNLTVVYINQPRTKIGFVMGNPEILPGPAFQNYQAFLKLRLTGKPVLKEKIAAVPIYSTNSARIVKKKFPCIRQSAEWQTILYPHGDHRVLDLNNHKHIEKLLEELDYLVKDKKDWVLYPDGECFNTKTAAVQHAMADYDALLKFFIDDMLLLYKDELEDQIETASKAGHK